MRIHSSEIQLSQVDQLAKMSQLLFGHNMDYASETMIDFTVRFWPCGSQTVNIGDGISASNIYG